MKKLITVTVCALLMLGSASVFAERLEVFRWQALDNKTQELVGSLMAAAKLHEKSGATVGIYQIDVGAAGNATFDYVLRWDTSAAWAKTKAYNTSDEWMAFFAEAGKNPSGKLLSSLEGLNWDASVSASSFAGDGPYRVFVWAPTPGMMGDVYEAFMQAKSIHEKLGAKVDIYNEGVGGSGKVHYVMSWDDWSAMAKSGDAIAASAEFRALQASAAGQAQLMGSIQGVPLYYSN